MNVVRWIYARIGQMTCFSFAGISFFSISTNEASDPLPTAIIGAAFLVGGLVLRHQHRTAGLR